MTYFDEDAEAYALELARETEEEFARKKSDLVIQALAKILPEMSLEQLLDIWDSHVGGYISDENDSN